MPTDVPQDGLKTEEETLKCDPMTLSSTPTVRRGSTPLPIKHQLRREEAVHDDCDWSSDAACGTSVPPPLRFSPALDDTTAMTEVEGKPEGPLRIALLGQNGVGKSSLAFALVGDGDRMASVDSDGEGQLSFVTVDDEESAILIYDNWRHDLSALCCEVCVLVFSVTDRRSFHRTAQLRLLLRETQPQTPIILVGNKSDLVRSREVTSQDPLLKTHMGFHPQRLCLAPPSSTASIWRFPPLWITAPQSSWRAPCG
ncbi:GTP-binding protein REM 2-like isoform X2 [Corythoichthys intestinalis]|uniref:GTP-binding protein REM 2-like isoform X2 n=1 Tax=Corythoichthys intestinalis TaxID=161448 RepID=UPI0025A628DD|nr:GTP-binding protein REM 2-like isoform X2 [Corythoichthys intestinalis]